MKNLAIIFAALLAGSALLLARVHTQLDGVKEELAAERLTNELNKKALERLDKFSAASYKFIKAYQNDAHGLEELKAEIRSSVAQLLQNDKDFRDWARGVVPADAVRMYNSTSRSAGTPAQAKP